MSILNIGKKYDSHFYKRGKIVAVVLDRYNPATVQPELGVKKCGQRDALCLAP